MEMLHENLWFLSSHFTDVEIEIVEQQVIRTLSSVEVVFYCFNKGRYGGLSIALNNTQPAVAQGHISSLAIAPLE